MSISCAMVAMPVCLLKDYQRSQGPFSSSVQGGRPMEKVALDILGPLPTSYKGNKYVLLVADCFTHWTEAYALPNQETVTIAEKLVTDLYVALGLQCKY